MIKMSQHEKIGKHDQNKLAKVKMSQHEST